MNGKVKLGVLFAALGLAAAVPAATPPFDVHVEVAEEIFVDPSDFIASGTAVDDGLVCESGEVEDIAVTILNPGGPVIRILDITKRFTCDDSSGTFDLRLLVRLNLLTHYTTASWRVISGTDAYAGLQGRGSLAGTPVIPGVSIDDVYDGWMR